MSKSITKGVDRSMVLVGKRGRIRLSDDKCTAFITNEILKQERGKIVHFQPQELVDWLKLLQIEGTEDGSIRISTWPSNE